MPTGSGDWLESSKEVKFSTSQCGIYIFVITHGVVCLRTVLIM